MPVLLGDGMPLLPPGAHRQRLALTRHTCENEKSGICLLEYRVVEKKRAVPKKSGGAEEACPPSASAKADGAR